MVCLNANRLNKGVAEMNKRQRKKFLKKMSYIRSMSVAFALGSKALDYFVLELVSVIKQMNKIKMKYKCQ